MCEPSIILGAALSLAQTGAGLAAEKRNADAQRRANAQRAENVREATVENYAALQARREEERAAAGQKIEENQREALRARERARVAAGEAGVSGLSVDALVRDLGGQEARFAGAVRQNFDAFSAQTEREMEQAERGARAELRSMPEPTPPDYLGAGVRAGLTIFDAASSVDLSSSVSGLGGRGVRATK